MKWICSRCATSKGLVLPNNSATWHEGQCEACREEVPVTDVMRFTHHTGANLPADRGTRA